MIATLFTSAAKIFLGPVGAVCGLVVSVGLCVTATVMHFELKSVQHDKATLQQAISDPKTGYVARLAQADTNVVTLKTSLTSQNKALSDLSAADAARLATVSKTVAAAQSQVRVDTGRLAIFDAHKDVGNDVCSRVQDEDKQVQELLR